MEPKLATPGSCERPLSFAQERLWFLDQINPGDPGGNICRAFRVTGQLRPELLHDSLQAVVNRHESLRSTFATTQLMAGVDSKPVQLVATHRVVEIGLVDLSLLAPEQRETNARELARSEAQQPFDLTLGPLLRLTLLKLADQDHVLILTLHRIISDERSVEILIRDLGEHYSAQTAHAPLPIQFGDYAAWQCGQVNSEAFRSHVDYWKEKLAGAPVVTELPITGSRPAMQNGKAQSVTFEIQEPLYRALKSIDDPFATLVAAFQLLISRYSGQYDVVIGSTVDNREISETRDLIGPFENAIVFRTDVMGDETFAQLLTRVNAEIRSAREHASVPFEMLLDELEVERSLSHVPVFQIAIY